MRGNPHDMQGDAPTDGSIPAYAGEPLIRRWTTAKPGVYPRVCGGTGELMPENPIEIGLSPRMRGNLGYRIGGQG